MKLNFEDLFMLTKSMGVYSSRVCVCGCLKGKRYKGRENEGYRRQKGGIRRV